MLHNFAMFLMANARRFCWAHLLSGDAKSVGREIDMTKHMCACMKWCKHTFANVCLHWTRSWPQSDDARGWIRWKAESMYEIGRNR
jgi:hypothetical protein